MALKKFVICLSALYVLSLVASSARRQRCLNLRQLVGASLDKSAKLKILTCPAKRHSNGDNRSAARDDVISFMVNAAKNHKHKVLYEQRLEAKFNNKTRLNETEVCKPSKVLTKEVATELRTDCPFKWVRNVKKDRVPEVLMEAKCLCEGRSKSMKAWKKHHENVDISCEKVQYVMPVLWREDCNAKIQRLRWGTDQLTIACVRVITARESAGKKADEHWIPRPH